MDALILESENKEKRIEYGTGAVTENGVRDKSSKLTRGKDGEKHDHGKIRDEE